MRSCIWGRRSCWLCGWVRFLKSHSLNFSPLLVSSYKLTGIIKITNDTQASVKLAILIFFVKISIVWPSEVSRTFSPAFAAGWDYYRRLRAGPASVSQWRVSMRCGISVSTSHGLSWCSLYLLQALHTKSQPPLWLYFKLMALCQCCLTVLEIRAKHQCSSKPWAFQQFLSHAEGSENTLLQGEQQSIQMWKCKIKNSFFLSGGN